MTDSSANLIWSAKRRRLVAALLLLLPLMLYANTIFSRYGFRDDYAILREANEEPGKLIRLCSSHSRPLYGLMLESFFSQLDEIDDLWAGRAAGALCIGGIAALLFLGLLRLGWPPVSSALFGALMAVLPAAQVEISWAICWPHAAGALCGIAAFLVAEGGGWFRRMLAGLLVATGALMYQPNSLFYVVLVAAGLMAYRGQTMQWRARWLIRHLFTVVVALAFAFAMMQVLYATGIFKVSRLVTLESELWDKLWWFATGPLVNALAVVVLNDSRSGISFPYVVLSTAVAGIILLGGWGELRRGGWREGAFWAASLVILSISAFVVSLIAAHRWSTYRTIYPLTGVCLVFFMLGLQHLSARLSICRVWLAPAALAALVAVGAPLASWQAYTLFALPQQQELALMEEGARRVVLKRQPVVFVVRPRMQDSPAPGFFSDEFGSLSTNSEWTSKEMFKLLLKERYPYLRDLYKRFTFACGHRLPLKAKVDVVIDMRELRHLRDG